jgi:hypothetical protein
MNFTYHEDDIIDGEIADPNVEFTNGAPPSPYGPQEPVQIKALEVSYERKFNLGNFESLQVTITIWARTRVAEGETFDLHNARIRLRDMARANVRAQLLREKGKADVAFLGLAVSPTDPDPIYVRTVSVGIARKVNLGNYESVAPSYTDWADLRHIAGNQAALHLALERMWASVWANIDDEISRARGLGSHPDAFFGLSPLDIEDLTGEEESPLFQLPAVTVPANGRNGQHP